MRKWNRTDIVWNKTCNTDIEISDWWEKKVTVLCHVQAMGATSTPDGLGQYYVVIGRCGSCMCKTDRDVAEGRLRQLQGGHGITLISMSAPRDLHNGTRFGINFKLNGNAHFVDGALGLAKSVIIALGCPAEMQVHYLARFKIHQETVIRVNKAWMGFSDYVRFKHDLPSLLGTGWSDT